MQIEDFTALPSEIDTVEKLYLWCFYLLSSSKEKVKIEGEYEYLVDGELIRPDGVDPRLFFVTKINLPIDENWLIRGFKLWENAQEIVEGLIEGIVTEPFFENIKLLLKGDTFPVIDDSPNPKTVLGTTGVISESIFKYGFGSFTFSSSSFRLTIADQSGLSSLNNTTWEFWIRISTYPSRNAAIFYLNETNTTNNWLLIKRYSSQIQIFNWSSITLAFGWQHLAFVFTSTYTDIFQNGIKKERVNNLILPSLISGKSIRFGSYDSVSPPLCQLDSIRITEAIRYTANFNPETDTYLAY